VEEEVLDMLRARLGSLVNPSLSFQKCTSSQNLGLTRALAAEAGSKNIRVNVIVPGYIETAMIAGKSCS